MRKNLSKAISTFLIAGIVATGLNGIAFPNHPNQVNAATVEAGTPYNASGNYDVSVEHVVINQVYGGGNNKGAGSHGFIELYNPTDENVDLSTWSIQYEGSTGDDKNAAGWHKLDLTGSIPARSSYLIRTKKYKDDKTPSNYTVPEGDMQWNDVTINGKGVAVALMSNQQLLTDNDVFDNTTKKPLKDGYVDLVGVNGNDGLTEQKALAFEGYATDSQSTKKAVRRIDFQDTDCNAVGEDDGDFVIIEYNATDEAYLKWAEPRTTRDGAWEASEMPEFQETTSLSDSEINVLTNTFGNNVESTRQFIWQMPESFSEGYVNVSTKEDMSNRLTFNATRTLNVKKTASVFKAEATGLAKNTKYYYQAVCGDVKSSVYSFTTGSLSDDFTFVRASDSQSKTEDGYDIFQKAITKMNDTYHTSFIMETGDLVDTNYFEDEWRWFIGKSQSMFANTAYIPVIGNHEETSSYKAWAFREHFSVPNACEAEGVTPGTVYSFDYGKAHFIVLNSECKGDGLKAQAQWADKDLANTKQKYIIAAIHRGPYGGAGISTDLADTFTPIFDKYNVELVLFGHDHSYIRTKALKNGKEDKDGTVYLECGGCASKQDNANATIPGYADITGTPGMPVYDVITVTDECIKINTVTVDINTGTISSLQDTGTMNYVNPDAKIDFEVLPKTHQKASAETGKEPSETKPDNTEPTTDNNSVVTIPAASSTHTPVKGKTYVVGNGKYKVTTVTANGGTATYLGIKGKKTAKLTVPSAVKIGKTNCKVTAISANAFKNNKKVTTIVIGKNVKTIGKKAFYGCKNLKKITMKSKVLKKVGAKAFTRTNKKLVIKVPAKKRILNLLNKREMCVCEIEYITEINQSNLSRHLKNMTNLGLLINWKEN
ncbi:MAG: metallophosphoesterase, partial [Anaerobutyricum sp.]|nr:metallophosphoesterase [Anaerobutyricum sp.]